MLAFLLRRFSVERDSAKTAQSLKWISCLSGGGLVFYVLCMNFASTDWLMSLEPDWFSTIFVVILMAGQFLSALALMTALLVLFAMFEPFAGVVTATHFHDLGNLLLAFVIFWTYVSFSQFLIIWSGNLPKEISAGISTAMPRAAGSRLGFGAVPGFVILGSLALLLLRSSKRNRQTVSAPSRR